MKICILGCGLRTPLLLHGLVHSGLAIEEIALYDIDVERANTMSKLASELARDSNIRVRAAQPVDNAIADASFVICSIRVGHMQARAADERLSLECGFAGQETTGPAGFSMALRTIPTALEYARLVEKLAPAAWIVNFTNPAGIITQAISNHTGARVVGICDTPAELFYQIARALDEPLDNVRCEYFGLNHLGWIRGVRLRGKDVLDRLLEDDELLRRLYPAELFAPAFLRALRLIPTEYLYFYYNQTQARANQTHVGVTRGEELASLNRNVWKTLEGCMRSGDAAGALTAYRQYLNRRNASYMRLDAEGKSAFNVPDPDWDPFEGVTGYHRIAVDTLRALISDEPHHLVLNVRNESTLEGLRRDDVIETQCMVDKFGARPLAIGSIPESVQGLVFSVKQFERLTIQAVIEGSWDAAVLALATNPIVGNWHAAHNYMTRLGEMDGEVFAGFAHSERVARS
jgi:6-phospho-beta-glucosidase